MEDRFKFRGMDANGKIRYGQLSQDKPDSTAYYKEYSQRICWDYSNIPVSNKTLSQCIGLKDENDKLIYEGDIVELYYDNVKMYTSIVKWDKEQAMFYIENPKNGETDRVGDYNLNLEIIGNIYENPELLKNEEIK